MKTVLNKVIACENGQYSGLLLPYKQSFQLRPDGKEETQYSIAKGWRKGEGRRRRMKEERGRGGRRLRGPDGRLGETVYCGSGNPECGPDSVHREEGGGAGA